MSGIGVVNEQKVSHGGLVSFNTVPAGGLSTLSLGVIPVLRSSDKIEENTHITFFGRADVCVDIS